MATGYTYAKYTTDAGTIGRIRASSQTINATGQGVVTGAVDDPNVYAFAGNPGSKRKKQLNARGVRLKRLVGTAPNQFNRFTFLPIFTQAALAAIAVDSTITLNSVVWTVADKVNEA